MNRRVVLGVMAGLMLAAALLRARPRPNRSTSRDTDWACRGCSSRRRTTSRASPARLPSIAASPMPATTSSSTASMRRGPRPRSRTCGMRPLSDFPDTNNPSNVQPDAGERVALVNQSLRQRRLAVDRRQQQGGGSPVGRLGSALRPVRQLRHQQRHLQTALRRVIRPADVVFERVLHRPRQPPVGGHLVRRDRPVCQWPGFRSAHPQPGAGNHGAVRVRPGRPGEITRVGASAAEGPAQATFHVGLGSVWRQKM